MAWSVPYTEEWAKEPTFQETPCCCMRALKQAWPDCISCHGSGRAGTISNTWIRNQAIAKGLPRWVGDPRFDCRVMGEESKYPIVRQSPGCCIVGICIGILTFSAFFY